MGRSTVHYADNKTNNALKKLHNKLRPAGTPVQRVEYIIELLLLRIFETKIKQDEEFKPLRKLFSVDYKWKNPKKGADAPEETNENRLFSYLPTVSNDQILSELNDNFFPFYSSILSSARQVFEGNLPQKVQDQLVLIEEVFSNSNFTNNVNSGNLGEVISIVANDIEEARLLKTDLLGDAIESALSETGGTKDVGLFRTPDHIRQFMTAMIEPTFDDIIFDPACGTGGFLFDAFEFVMRRVDPDREWPGEKAHSELSAWFDEYFKFNQLDFPSIEQTTQFYRTGVTGIEYLGMIRKMAAINFYVRGLNPANIEQGDSLAKYRPVTDHESKSVILANPPFGAQRDQESYPDVWGEFSKESETTILFVKLMFEQLKAGGRCAVVVSEGFHTWDQFSAKALRKMLLDEAQLKAVISLPQGLFVSKSGQGPKTSILIFEKGGKTDWTWFYKITNDGYTMGTNRKEQKGNQLIECLTLWHEYVKHGKQPPETKNQFCIPAEWIKTLDPRIKEKIRTETRADMEAKGKIEREKKEADLDKKIKAKKATEADKSMELKTFDQMLENRIQNEIAKRIDKAHNYSFNLANYKSTISDSQIVEWTEALKHIQPNGATTLEEVYKKLNNGKSENILPYLLKLNPTNALEADIAREYVSNLDNDLILKYKELNVIKEILKSGAKYEKEKLGNLMALKREILKLEDFNPDYRIVEKIRFKDGAMILRNDSETGIDLQFAEIGDLLISKINFHQGATAINNYGKVLTSLDYIVYEVEKSKAIPSFVHLMVRDKSFIQYVNENKPGGIKGRSKPEFIESLEIPLPSLEEQEAIVAQIEKQKAIIEGVEKILINANNAFSDDNYTRKPIGDFAKVLGGYSFPSTEVSETKYENQIPLIKIGSVLNGKITDDLGYVSENYRDSKPNFVLRKGDIVFAMTRPIIKSGLKYAIIDDQFDGSMLNQRVGKWQFYSDDLLPSYLAFFMGTEFYLKQLESFCSDEANQPNVSNGEFESILIPLPSIDKQVELIKVIEEQNKLLEGLRRMKDEAQNKITQILADVWGVEFVEPENVLVEDEQEN
jgi:type I restriction-modification system DNA methylase subunit/restriction endonuclease S subunit